LHICKQFDYGKNTEILLVAQVFPRQGLNQKALKEIKERGCGG
jgi:hypothetical protein